MKIIDQIGTKLIFDHTPKRIVSLVPSQTELLAALGLRDQILGVTKFCVHPEDLRKSKMVVGGTKQVSLSKIKALQPDIILCNKEENTKEMVSSLRKIAPVHVSDVKTVQQSYELITQYGEIFFCQSLANVIIQDIILRRSRFRESVKEKTIKDTVAYVIWKGPLMVAGSDTFINALLEDIGLENSFKSHSKRYPQITWKDLKNVDFIFLSSEPYPFREKHLAEFIKHTNAKILLVDGEYFSWYGARLKDAYTYFEELLGRLELKKL